MVATETIAHDTSHVRDLDAASLPAAEAELGAALAAHLQRTKAVMGVFDEGCMGMYNAIIDDEVLNPMGIYKERLSQSASTRGCSRSPTARRRPSSSGWSTAA